MFLAAFGLAGNFSAGSEGLREAEISIPMKYMVRKKTDHCVDDLSLSPLLLTARWWTFAGGRSLSSFLSVMMALAQVRGARIVANLGRLMTGFGLAARRPACRKGSVPMDNPINYK